MQVGYVLREGFSGFKRAKLSMVAAIATVSFSLLLLSVLSIFLLNANRVIESLRDRVEMEAFLAEYLTPEAANAVRAQVAALEGVHSVRFISKEEAARIFKEEFGEDIYKVLNFNPLPASLKIFLKDGHKTAAGAEAVYRAVKRIKGIEDVIYRKTLLEMLDQRAMTFLWFSFGIGVFIALSSIFLVANTIRLAIYAKRKIIQTMKLIGATRTFIRIPFLIEGFFQGLMGGVTATVIVYALLEAAERWLSVGLSEFVQVAPVSYGVIVAAGCLLGLLGSMISIRRFITEGVVD
jgi:cell division transport system permease protein